MSRDSSLFLADILECCHKIRRYTAGVGYEAFQSDSMRFDAVVRNIELIGEAARQLPVEVLEEMHEIPWTKIMSMRNILAHAYFGIDSDIVWDVAINEIPRLQLAVMRYS